MKNTNKTNIYKRKIKKSEGSNLKSYHNKGITLIALAVTIVVLLILAGITLNYTIGDNGIIKEAQRTKNEVIDKTTSAEQSSQNLITEIAGEERIDGVNKHRLYISTDLSSSDITDSGFTLNIGVTYSEYELSKIEWFYKLSSDDSYSTITDTYTNSSSSTAISVSETHTFSNLTGGNYSVYAIVYDAAGHYQKSSTILTGVIQIGSTVTYSPSGSYTWQAQYYASDDSYSDVQLSTSGYFGITSWKVLAIDGSTLTLVPSSPTTGTVPLQGVQGYNNAVKLLNDACNFLYGNSNKGITARNINIEDIENYMTDTALSEIKSYNNGSVTLGNKATKPYTTYNCYPLIYEQELKSVINGKESNSGLGASEQTSFISRTQSTSLENATTTSATNGYLQARTSINPYLSMFIKDATFMSSAFKSISNGAVDNYYNLLLPNGTNTKYWIASRAIGIDPYACQFNVRVIGGGGIGGYGTYHNRDGSAITWNLLFPVLSINSSILSGSETNGIVIQ